VRALLRTNHRFTAASAVLAAVPAAVLGVGAQAADQQSTNGPDIYKQNGCAVCHAALVQAASAMMAWLQNPQQFVPGNAQHGNRPR